MVTVKVLPLADLAGDGDAAAQGLGDAAADGQAQARAAELPRHRAVGLHERIEDRLELLRRGCRCPCRSRRTTSCGSDATGTSSATIRTPPALGELDGVAHQVHQQLPQARRIGAESFPAPGRTSDSQA